MSQRIHYNNPPIVEALIDIHVTPSDGASEHLKDVIAPLKQSLPVVEQIATLSTVVQAEPEGIRHISATQQPIAYRFLDIQKRQVAILRDDGFTFSLLYPYTQWEDLRDNAKSSWQTYVNFTRPLNVTRIAVRYINRLDLPEPVDDLAQFLKALPALPTTFPGGRPSSYVMQLQVPQTDISGMLLLNAGYVEPSPEKPNTVAIALDIDLFCILQNPIDINDNALWDILERLHERKNEIFESSVTDETRRLFQ